MTTRFKLSLDQYHQMVDAGILENSKVEFVEGELIEMTPEKPIHSGKGNRLASLLRSALGENVEIRTNNPITLENSEPEPDIVVCIRDRDYYENRHPNPNDIYLIVEISNSTLGYDTVDKRNVYARAGIYEYWIVDLRNNKIYIFRNPEQGSYLFSTELTMGKINLQSFPDLEIDIKDIFPQKDS